MKNRIIIAALALFFVAANVNAQSELQKIGYTSTDYILSLLPAAKKIQQELADYNEQLTAQLQSKEQTFQDKYANYQRNAANMTELIRKDTERELQSLDASLAQFKIDAQKSFSTKQQTLLQPVLEEIRVAIQQVAEENNFTHIINSGTSGVDVLLFAKEEYNVSDLVLAKLGVEPPASSN